MRIIKMGVLPEKVKYQIECKTCGTIIELEKDEFDVCQQYNEQYYAYRCPVCTRTIVVMPEALESLVAPVLDDSESDSPVELDDAIGDVIGDVVSENLTDELLH